MPRKLRLEFSGACYHVINRGNYRRDVFASKGAAGAFEGCLFEACGKFGWRLHAYVVMRNHYHLALETPEPNLSVGMKWLQGTWAARFNRHRGESGRPFQGRYKALHVEPGHALAQVAHYIHLNPTRARVVKAEDLAGFPWSSLRLFGRKDCPEFLVGDTILAESGGLADTAAGWRNYRSYLAAMAEEQPRKRDEKFGRLSRGWMVGSAEFKKALHKDLARLGANLDRAHLHGTGAVRELREAGWEEKLLVAARALKIDLRKLPARKSAPEKVALAAVLKSATAVSNGWLAERLAMGQPASVSQFVRRFRLDGKEREPRFAAARAKIKRSA